MLLSGIYCSDFGGIVTMSRRQDKNTVCTHDYGSIKFSSFWPSDKVPTSVLCIVLPFVYVPTLQQSNFSLCRPIFLFPFDICHLYFMSQDCFMLFKVWYFLLFIIFVIYSKCCHNYSNELFIFVAVCNCS